MSLVMAKSQTAQKRKWEETHKKVAMKGIGFWLEEHHLKSNGVRNMLKSCKNKFRSFRNQLLQQSKSFGFKNPLILAFAL